MKKKYKIFYQDNMTCYYLDETFNSWESANDWILENLGNTCNHTVEEVA